MDKYHVFGPRTQFVDSLADQIYQDGTHYVVQGTKHFSPWAKYGWDHCTVTGIYMYYSGNMQQIPISAPALYLVGNIDSDFNLAFWGFSL